MSEKPTVKVPQCPMDYAFNRLGGRYKARVIWHLQAGPVRYGQLRRLLRNVSAKMLTQVLHELEADGLIERHEFPEVPPRVEYTLLEDGLQLLPSMMLLRGWAVERMRVAGIPLLRDNESTVA